MPRKKNELLQLGAEAVWARRRGVTDPEVYDDIERRRAVARITRYVQDVVDEAPPLTQEQRDKLSALIQRVQPSGGDAA